MNVPDASNRPSFPRIDRERLLKAVRAVMGEYAPEPDEDGEVGFWMVGGPGLNRVTLALAVVSAEIVEYLMASSLTDDELQSLERIRALPEDRALREIDEGLWDDVMRWHHGIGRAGPGTDSDAS